MKRFNVYLYKQYDTPWAKKVQKLTLDNLGASSRDGSVRVARNRINETIDKMLPLITEDYGVISNAPSGMGCRVVREG